MSDAIEIISNIMQADLNQLRAISNNLSNVNTTGFKRELTTNISVYRKAIEMHGSLSAQYNQMPTLLIDNMRTLSQGVLKATGNDLDLAIEGDVAFVVNKNGEHVYTRRGDLMIDATGRLALTSGEPLQGLSNDIFVGNETFEVGKKGELIRDEQVFDQLQVVQFDNSSQVEYLGSGFFNVSQFQEFDENNYSVMQGYLESSNVNPADEMIKLIEVVRRFETSSKILQTYDGMVEHAITELGRF